MSIEKSPGREGLSWLPALVTIGIVLMGASWAVLGYFKYGLWVNNGPGAGFFPVVAGLGAAVLGIYEFLFSPVKAKAVGTKSLWPAVAMAITVASIPLVGMVLAMALFIVLWILVIERKTWHKAVLTGAGAGTGIYLVFALWLKVPFPQGFFLELMR
ncbi:tripartite tricarboxylate transporter TctB family protein [Litchfieldella xinjiangensis]|uniref:tripartite tricarboxylate transporter TctB family protein n=1 Tax=Litchfieldella xinjiangensis TaxID=1166948 RepID=UPI0005B935FA|nr:tripartite tricarboxylate transporter TctB family protein [Halomonas xinjiangensis]